MPIGQWKRQRSFVGSGPTSKQKVFTTQHDEIERNQPTRKVRPWAEDDLVSVQEITWLTWLDAYSSFIRVEDLKVYFDEHYSLRALSELFHDKRVDGFVAKVGNDIAGYEKNMFRGDEGRYYVSSLYILPRFQGLRLGRDFLTCAEEKALEHGLDRIWLGVMVENKLALTWYKKHGFEFVEELPFTMGKATVSHVIGYRLIHRDS